MGSDNATPDLVTLLRRTILHAQLGVRTATVGRVNKYDPATQRAEVQPLVKELETGDTGDLEASSLPPIHNVPVVFPGAGAFRLTFPIAAGDTVLLIISDRSLDKWKGQGGEVDPVDPRNHNLSDAIAIPGLRPFSAALDSPPTDAIALGFEGGAEIQVKDGEISIDAGGTGVVNINGALQVNLGAALQPVARMTDLVQAGPFAGTIVAVSQTITKA